MYFAYFRSLHAHLSAVFGDFTSRRPPRLCRWGVRPSKPPVCPHPLANSWLRPWLILTSPSLILRFTKQYVTDTRLVQSSAEYSSKSFKKYLITNTAEKVTQVIEVKSNFCEKKLFTYCKCFTIFTSNTVQCC